MNYITIKNRSINLNQVRIIQYNESNNSITFFFNTCYEIIHLHTEEEYKAIEAKLINQINK